MESADCRTYRRHLIITRKTTIFRLRRYDVWRRGQQVATFRNLIEAELHIDSLVEQRADDLTLADPTPRELLATLSAPELAVLAAISSGRAPKETAKDLGLPLSDLQAIKKELFAKIGASSTADALRIGRFGGLPEQLRG